MRHCLFLLFWLPLAALGQAQVSGKVLDARTQQPVPYASVVLPGTRVGTSANAEGEFVLQVPALPATVRAFSLGYGRDSATATQAGAAGAALTLRLAPAPVALPAVETPGYVAALVTGAYRVLQRTNARPLYGQALYRQLTYLDQQPTQLLEMLWQTRANSAGLLGTALGQGRFAERKGALISFNNLTYYTKHLQLYDPAADTMLLGTMLSPYPTRMYTLRLRSLSEREGHTLAEVEFVGKPEMNPQHVLGSLTIDTDTYQLLRFRAGIDTKSTTNNPTFKPKNSRVEYDFVFAPQAGGAVPDHFTITFTESLGRLLKPDVQVRAVGYTYFHDWQASAPPGVAYAPANGQEKDLEAIRQKPYDPAFWRDNPVVKRTPLEDETIRSLEQQQAFGAMRSR